MLLVVYLLGSIAIMSVFAVVFFIRGRPLYSVINLAASYDVCRNLQVFGRIENLFDKKYEVVHGYGVPGVSGYGGVKASF